MNKQTKIILSIILAVLCLVTAVLVYGRAHRYRELPFGGMNGRVQKVTVYNLWPEMWFAGEKGTDVRLINTSVYDIDGHEICSALMDSAGRIITEAESMFKNGVCVRSTQKSGGEVIARITLSSHNKGVFEYNKETGGKLIRMTVKENTGWFSHKSVVTEDGNVTTISMIHTNRKGYPVKITVTEPQTGQETVETNIFDDNNNIIEKHVAVKGEKKEEVTYTEYFDYDEYGNWREARTYTVAHLPVDVLVREIEYW